MLTAAAVLFAVAAVGGLVMTVLHLKDKAIPLGLAIVHGLVAAIALVMVLLTVTGGGASSLLTYALILFVVAALGGFVLFAHQLQGKPLPTPLIFIHAAVGLVGFGLLVKVILDGAA